MSRIPGSDPMQQTLHVKTFSQTGDFRALDAAREALEGAGFSVGQLQKGKPIGILFGNFMISKWRNMTLQEQQTLHGTIEGNFRNGPLTVRLRSNAPAAAIPFFEAIP